MNADDYRAVLPEGACSLLELLGDAVLLKCQGKRPLGKGWDTRTVADMTPKYLASLRDRNIGVLLGAPSGGLCSIDLDDDDAAAAFLAANPLLASSLRTRGARGCNIWLRIRDEYPASAKLKNAFGSQIGEWRADKSQTIIYGVHPDTHRPYEVLHRARPATVPFRDISWPDGVSARWRYIRRDGEAGDAGAKPSVFSRCSLSSSASPPSLGSPLLSISPASPYSPSHSVLIGKQAMATKLAYERARPKQAKLFERMTRRYKPEPHSRNEFITLAVPFLFKAVCEHLLIEFSMHFYDINAAIFKDSRERHGYETQQMLASVEAGYGEELNTTERDFYLSFADEEHHVAFRICRDLALLETDESPRLQFFLALDDLACRIERSTPRAQAVMENLRRFGVIAVEQRGTRYSPGQRGRATRYRYCLEC